MAINNPYAKYQSQSVNTATKEELTLMLYEGCVKFINRAIIGIEDKNIEMANNNILKAQDIIQELNMTLNMDYEIAQSMRSLYTYMLEQLMEANLKKDKVILEEVKGYAADFRDTWKEAMKRARMGK